MTVSNKTRQVLLRWSFGHRSSPALIALLLCMAAAHLSLLRVAYFWDETYFAAAARDCFFSARLIPSTAGIESHPPLVSVWVAGWWKLFGFGILTSRLAMLTVAAGTLAAVHRLARMLTSEAAAIAATALTAVYPVFFSHSTMVQLDMPAAGLVLWGLLAYLRDRRWSACVLFSLAALSKETAIVAPLAILVAESIMLLRNRESRKTFSLHSAASAGLSLLAPLLTLLLWYAWQYRITGTLLGESGYVQYNLQSTLNPLRIAPACLRHLWHLLGYLNIFVLTGFAGIICMIRPHAPARSMAESGRRAWPLFFAVIAGYVSIHSVAGGATLARYMLPVYPLVVIVCVALIAERVKWWPLAAAVSAAAFTLGLFSYPSHYGFALEDNLAYTDFVTLHQDAIAFLTSRQAPMVMTSFPAYGELSEPWLGYTSKPLPAMELESFTLQEFESAKANPPPYILLFPQVFSPPHPVGLHWLLQGKRDLFSIEQAAPEEVIRLMHARVVFYERRHLEWVAVLSTVPSQQR